ncbi:MAG: hypothetical protein MJ209_01330 [archaeon]|nr:hypothetical protein [archaeon]
MLYCQNVDYFRAVGLLIGVTSAFLIEEKYIHFKNTRNIKHIILRLLGGMFVFGFVLLPLTFVFPHGSNPVVYIFRGIAHGVAFFVSMGLYPFVFKKFDRFFNE